MDFYARDFFLSGPWDEILTQVTNEGTEVFEEFMQAAYRTELVL